MATLKYYRDYLIALALFLLILLLLPAEYGLTQTGVNVLAVFIPVLYLWLFKNTDWVSLLALAGLVMTQCLTPAEVFGQSFGHPIIMTIIACMALNACLMQTGVINKIATWFITRRIVRGRPYMFLGMFLLSYLVLGTFMEILSLAIIYIAIAQALAKTLNYKKGDPFFTAMMLCILWGNAVATAASPISHALPMILIAQIEGTMGITVSFAKWLSIGIPYLIIMYILAMVIIGLIWKPDAAHFYRYDIEEIKSQSKPLGVKGKVSAVVFLLLIFLWIAPELGQTLLPEFCAYMSSIGSAVPPMIAVALLCVIRVKQKPIAQFSEISKDIPLGVLVFTGAVTVFGSVIGLESVGITAWIKNILEPLVKDVDPLILLALLLSCALVLTNFISNTVTMVLFFSIAFALLGSTEFNMVAIGLLIGLVSCFGVLTPSASVPAPLFFGSGLLTIKSTVKYNLIYIGLAFAATILMLLPLSQVLIT